ncbi:hypothetical protein B0H16DRAFT_610953 [Mycena metata]|uniref:Uncharacterized protein n=1 Tax=Mycena metata TaxID=1033252 RepID=A0AAD7KBL1_9AGAR|nr:hypothetical protein B0H16DRAFT_610953 [Mycena metata]
MAHLMASPFHKPSPFEFPQRTNSADTVPANAQLPTPATTSIIGGQDPHAAEYFDTPSASVADPSSRFRRATSSIVYHNSGLRESRERTVQRSSRSFVVVLPPPSLPQDHGHLGHTLSSGPRHRLAQGLLMPLFPTMYGQLTAIAREYNFPSTAGLCLYLHFTDNGITATPRISDDSWQMIWSHAFDPAPGTAHHSLPISGKIEFDIDMRLARWYGAWMASSHREHVDVPMSVTPSAAPSVVHFREDSRTSFADGDDQDTLPPRAAPRHVPRKLSLIDRFDTMSARSVPRSHVARPSPPDRELVSQKIMSPIFQEEEPKTAKYNLEHRVNSWRASSSVLPTAVAAVAAGHILLAGPDMPNSPPLEESPQRTPTNDEEQEYEYRIEDYAFSISSAGPGDYDPYSPLDWYYDPSIGLAQRAEGSVCMTPSYATSFGPSDYTLSDHVPSLDLNVRTPDIAHRMLEDVPPSPSIATSWGAPLSYPASPTSEYRAPSVDLGHRQEFSRPTTPMTATSWGAPESWPPSPTTPFYVHTPDAGQRAFDLSALADHDAPWSLVWPYHDAARPWNQVWPYNSGQLDAQAPAAGPSGAPWNMVWPYHNAAAAREVEQGQQQSSDSAAPWNMVWPYQSSSAAPWKMVWPYHAAELQGQQSSDSAAPWNMVWPYQSSSVAPWNMVWPYHATESSSGPVSVTLPAVYPYLNIYPAVYPAFDIYPAVSGALASSSGPVSVTLPAVYPYLNIYPAVYPAFEIYPAVSGAPSNAVDIVAAPGVYPNFDLYPAVSGRKVTVRAGRGPVTVRLAPAYPVLDLWNLDEIYPAVSVDDASWEISTRLAARYPSFCLYAPVYPYLEIYPSLPEDQVLDTRGVSAGTSTSYPHFNLYPAIAALAAEKASPSTMSFSARGPVSIRLAPAYPVLDLYPATYPGNLDEIYPAFSVDDASWEISTRLTARYPSFCLYAPVYPFLEIYPSLPEDCFGSRTADVGAASTGYPHFDLYPAIGAFASKRTSPPTSSRGAVVIRLAPAYPVLDLYSATYPWNLDEIYPANSVDDAAWEISTRLVARYPSFCLYPAVYPHFDLYPAASGTTFDVQGPGYPDFNLYPAVSPVAKASPRAVAAPAASASTALLAAGVLSAAVALSPTVSRPRQSPKVKSVDSVGAVSVRLDVAYPVFDLYPALYPSFEIYPALPEDCAPGVRQSPGVSIRLNVGYPMFDLYPAVYPSFEIYPALPEDCAPGMRQSPGVSIRLNVAYPIFDLYPAVYPAFEIYPALPEDCAPGVRQNRGVSIRLNVGYPIFDLYPALYPSFEIYPALPEDCAPGVRQGRGISIRAEPRYPYFNLYPAIYPYFDLWPTLVSMEAPAPRFPKQSRFTRSDLHALVKKSSTSFPQRNGGAPSKSHQALHLAVFPEGADVLTPSGGVPSSRRAPSKTHLDLHLSVYPSGVEVSTPSGTGFKDVTVAASTTTSTPPPPSTTASPSSRVPTRLRSGSVRMSLPPSPRPVGGRSPTSRAAATTPPAMELPEPPVRKAVPAPFPAEPLRRAVSTTTRPAALKGAPLSRSVSMAAPRPPVPETAPTLTGPRAIPPRKRDSMVLQRVRALQMNSEPPIKDDDPIANFPLPPRTTLSRKVVS